MNDNQSEAIAFLRAPSSYGPQLRRVDVVETHISIVFLAGEFAYKLKRAVSFPYLDFSTTDRRREACKAELALNRRTAPSLYLDVRALSRDGKGRLGFGPGGEVVDWVVVMRRFEEELLFDRLARKGRLSTPLMESLADEIARFHEAAERRPQFGSPADLLAIVEENDRCLGAAAGLFGEEAIAELAREARAHIAALAPLIERRREEGRVRRCHGDLHLRNICLVDGKPTLFDCLEFSEKLASTDTLYDLAFLLMDLEHRGERGFANRVLNSYLDRTDEEAGLALLPLFLSLRAAIRAHVAAATIAQSEERARRRPELASEAQSYLALARRVLAPRSPRLVAIGGLSGTGKTTLAQSLAPEQGRRPGARVLRSDVLRKRLMGVAPQTPLPLSAYRPAVSRRVYEVLREKAAAALAAGSSAIVDAVFLSPEERRAIAAVAEEAAVPFTGFWLGAPTGLLERRIGARRGDASDATVAVLHQQLQRDPGSLDWHTIDASKTAEDCFAAARGVLQET